jgi:hypothetical protein
MVGGNDYEGTSRCNDVFGAAPGIAHNSPVGRLLLQLNDIEQEFRSVMFCQSSREFVTVERSRTRPDQDQVRLGQFAAIPWLALGVQSCSVGPCISIVRWKADATITSCEFDAPIGDGAIAGS